MREVILGVLIDLRGRVKINTALNGWNLGFPLPLLSFFTSFSLSRHPGLMCRFNPLTGFFGEASPCAWISEMFSPLLELQRIFQSCAIVANNGILGTLHMAQVAMPLTSRHTNKASPG